MLKSLFQRKSSIYNLNPLHRQNLSYQFRTKKLNTEYSNKFFKALKAKPLHILLPISLILYSQYKFYTN